MYSSKILNFQESMTILNAYTKKSGNLLKAPHILSIDVEYWKKTEKSLISIIIIIIIIINIIIIIIIIIIRRSLPHLN